MPDLTPAEVAREAEQEAVVFSKAGDVDKLLSMLKEIDPTTDNLADNEDIQVCPCYLTCGAVLIYLQELYRSCMALRPKIVKLIDKYSQKRGARLTLSHHPHLNFGPS